MPFVRAFKGRMTAYLNSRHVHTGQGVGALLLHALPVRRWCEGCQKGTTGVGGCLLACLPTFSRARASRYVPALARKNMDAVCLCARARV